MSLARIVGTILLFLESPVIAAEPEAVIQVRADRTIAKISPFTIGACIEDVNHEIYGGLYSQMVFGESFQEHGVCRMARSSRHRATARS